MIILKIVLFLILILLAIIILILLMPLSIHVSYINGKLDYSIKYAFLKLMDSGGGGIAGKLKSGGNKSKKKKKNNKNEQNKKNVSENKKIEKPPEASTSDPVTEEYDDISKLPDEPEDTQPDNDEAPDTSETLDKKSRKTLGEIYQLVTEIWMSAKHPLRHILKGFHFSGLYIDFLVADEDAYNCALKYGKVSGTVYNTIAHMMNLFTLKFKTVDVVAGFGKEKSRWDVSFRLNFIPMTMVISGIWFLITYIFRVYLPKKRRKKNDENAECEVKK